MKFFTYFFIIISVFFSLACSKSKIESSKEVVFIDDGYQATSNNEVVFEESASRENSKSVNEKSFVLPEKNVTNTDRAMITTMFDGAGNKTETRFFDDDLLVRTIMVRTSVKGEKQVMVFAQNGTVKTLPANKQISALTASASEIAAVAGIFEGRKEAPKPITIQTEQKPESNFAALKSPVATAPIEQVEAQTPEDVSDQVTKPTSENPIITKRKTENTTSPLN